MVVKRADKALSGRSEFRKLERCTVAVAFSSAFSLCSFGMEMSRSLIIWSAVLRLSEDRNGASGLICATGGFMVSGIVYLTSSRPRILHSVSF